MQIKLPSFQFYPGDWQKHADLKRATKAEKGMLMDLLCLLWECQERGVFATAGTVWTDEEIASAAGGDNAENLLLLQGLLRKGILHRNKSGAVYSPRMVRDEDARKQAVKDGKKGGNPRLKGGDKGDANPNPTPSVAVSVSSSPAKIKEKNSGGFSSPIGGNNELQKLLSFMTQLHQEKRGSPLMFDQRKDSSSLERMLSAYGGATVRAAWEMWFYSGEKWSEWADRCGHGVPGFVSPSGIGVIAGAKERLSTKAKRYESEKFNV